MTDGVGAIKLVINVIESVRAGDRWMGENSSESDKLNPKVLTKMVICHFVFHLTNPSCLRRFSRFIIQYVILVKAILVVKFKPVIFGFCDLMQVILNVCHCATRWVYLQNL